MNGDLISRTSLLRNIGRYGVSIDPYNITQLITQKILAEPEVDAEPVRHGKWIKHIEPLSWCEDDVDVFVKCSLCGDTMPGETNFCPNCGVKMDAEVNGDE